MHERLRFIQQIMTTGPLIDKKMDNGNHSHTCYDGAVRLRESRFFLLLTEFSCSVYYT